VSATLEQHQPPPQPPTVATSADYPGDEIQAIGDQIAQLSPKQAKQLEDLLKDTLGPPSPKAMASNQFRGKSRSRDNTAPEREKSPVNAPPLDPCLTNPVTAG
jgi:hypothetical protein